MNTTDQVQDLFTHFPSANVKDVMRITEKSESTVRNVLTNLVREGELVKSDDGFYSLATASDDGDKPKRKNHGYARNTSSDLKANARDNAVIDVLTEVESLALKDIADQLNITVRSARHATWRLGRKGVVEQPARGQYALVGDGNSDS